MQNVKSAIRWLRSTKRRNASGYIILRSESGQEAYEHRVIAEEILGRTLEPWEEVHHINGDPGDNRLENLCVMDSEAHKLYHEWYSQLTLSERLPPLESQIKILRDLNGELLSDVVKKKNITG